MTIANDSLMQQVATLGITITDNMGAAATTQATATPLVNEVNRFTTANAGGTGAAILKSSLTNEAPPLCFVVNDSPYTIKIFPAIGEYQGGVLNASLSIPSGQSGIFVRVPPALATKGGNTGTGIGDWRSAVIP